MISPGEPGYCGIALPAHRIYSVRVTLTTQTATMTTVATTTNNYQTLPRRVAGQVSRRGRDYLRYLRRYQSYQKTNQRVSPPSSGLPKRTVSCWNSATSPNWTGRRSRTDSWANGRLRPAVADITEPCSTSNWRRWRANAGTTAANSSQLWPRRGRRKSTKVFRRHYHQKPPHTHPTLRLLW